MRRQLVEEIGIEQESVWDYPRPPAVRPAAGEVRVEFGGIEIARSNDALEVIETSHPPTVYIPPKDIVADVLTSSAFVSFCEFKGHAVYWNIAAGGRKSPNAGWSYPDPTRRFLKLRDFVAFYPSRVDACFIDDERVRAQEGDYYGGWITSRVTGPFKGGPGTWGW